MKKLLLKSSMLVLAGMLTFSVFGGTESNKTTSSPAKDCLGQPLPTPQKCKNSTPLRFAFWPGVWYWPANENIYGLTLGLPFSYGNGESVIGLDLGLFASETSNVTGLQAGIILNSSAYIDGAQLACINMVSNLTGVQLGVFNEAKESAGVQLGLINMAKSTEGVQIGLINFMKDGFFPIFPLFNFKF